MRDKVFFFGNTEYDYFRKDNKFGEWKNTSTRIRLEKMGASRYKFCVDRFSPQESKLIEIAYFSIPTDKAEEIYNLFKKGQGVTSLPEDNEVVVETTSKGIVIRIPDYFESFHNKGELKPLRWGEDYEYSTPKSGKQPAAEKPSKPPDRPSDDSLLEQRVRLLEQRVAALEEKCK